VLLCSLFIAFFPRPTQIDLPSMAASDSIAATPAWKALQEHVADIERT
jgi:hypothetical protein